MTEPGLGKAGRGLGKAGPFLMSQAPQRRRKWGGGSGKGRVSAGQGCPFRRADGPVLNSLSSWRGSGPAAGVCTARACLHAKCPHPAELSRGAEHTGALLKPGCSRAHPSHTRPEAGPVEKPLRSRSRWRRGRTAREKAQDSRGTGLWRFLPTLGSSQCPGRTPCPSLPCSPPPPFSCPLSSGSHRELSPHVCL